MTSVAPPDRIRHEQREVRQSLSPEGKPRELYSEAGKAEDMIDKRYEIRVKTMTNHSAEAIKNIIKTSINPTSMKVGICAFRTRRDGKVLLETKSK